MLEKNNPHLDSPNDTSQKLVDAAAKRDYELQPERIENLVEIIAEMKKRAELPGESIYKFVENGLEIERPIKKRLGSEFSAVSYLDFLPNIEKDSDVMANPHPQRANTTPFTVMGIEAFQDFVLLADAGFISKPDKFFGKTNPTMAKFAKRVGFEAAPGLSNSVVADYETVAEHLFSPKILDIHKKLSERLAVKAAGQVAICADPSVL